MHPISLLRNLNMYMVVLITINLYTKFEMSSFSCSKDMIGAPKFRILNTTQFNPTVIDDRERKCAENYNK